MQFERLFFSQSKEINTTSCPTIKHDTIDSAQNLPTRLKFKSYRYQLLQHVTANEKEPGCAFCSTILESLKDDELYAARLVFSIEARFPLSDHFNRHILRIWGREYEHAVIEYARDSSKVNVFCAVSRLVSGPFFYTNAL
jgi:hypothetical protein